MICLIIAQGSRRDGQGLAIDDQRVPESTPYFEFGETKQVVDVLTLGEVPRQACGEYAGDVLA